MWSWLNHARRQMSKFSSLCRVCEAALNKHRHYDHKFKRRVINWSSLKTYTLANGERSPHKSNKHSNYSSKRMQTSCTWRTIQERRGKNYKTWRWWSTMLRSNKHNSTSSWMRQLQGSKNESEKKKSGIKRSWDRRTRNSTRKKKKKKKRKKRRKLSAQKNVKSSSKTKYRSIIQIQCGYPPTHIIHSVISSRRPVERTLAGLWRLKVLVRMNCWQRLIW